MTDPLRLPLAVSTSPRSNSYQDKDALVVNAYIDKSTSQVHYLVKRPGFLLGTEAITTGLNLGIYINPYDGFVYYYNGTLNHYTPTNYWDNNTSYSSGDAVYYNGEVWYSQIEDNQGSIPGTSEDWGESPPEIVTIATYSIFDDGQPTDSFVFGDEDNSPTTPVLNGVQVVTTGIGPSSSLYIYENGIAITSNTGNPAIDYPANVLINRDDVTLYVYVNGSLLMQAAFSTDIPITPYLEYTAEIFDVVFY